MKKRHHGFTAKAGLTIMAVLVLASSAVSAGVKAPFDNTILVYCDPARDWPAGSFSYYLAYMGKDGVPQDWLFDGFLFLSIGAASGGNFWDGKAGKADWDAWLDKIFENGRQLDALETDAADLENKLGSSEPKKVILSIPRPPSGFAESRQAAVIKDFVDRSIRRFAEKKYARIVLDGFYWFHEGVDGTDAGLVNGLHADLQKRGYRLYWIPYDVGRENRAHLERWKRGAIRFDGIWLQPNYFWAERNAKYAAQDLDDTVAFARDAGAAVEIEFDHRAYATGWKLGRYAHYLISSKIYGYGGGPVMYYDGYRGYIKCGESSDPVLRAVYDDLYWFTRDKYLPKPLTYPGRFWEKGKGEDPEKNPRLGFWIEKDASPARLFLVEPDPNKDYLIILRPHEHASGRLEILAGGRWSDLGGAVIRGGAAEGRFRLPRSVLQKIWNPAKPLVASMRWTGGSLVDGWARPDDFVFRYLKDKQPMETEMRLGVKDGVLSLDGIAGEICVGLRSAAGKENPPAPRLRSGRLAGKPVVRESVGETGGIDWLRAAPNDAGRLEFEFGPGNEPAEIWAFPSDTVFHLRPGSCGDTNAGLHVPGASLVPDGRWKLGGEFGRNHRIGAEGAGIRIIAPPLFKKWTLTLLIDAEGDVDAAVDGDKPRRLAGKADDSSGFRRFSILLEPGVHTLVFKQGISLHDVWLERR